jgi:hypothetical protein
MTRRDDWSDWAREAGDRLADAGRAYDWAAVLNVLHRHDEFVNFWRPGGTAWYAPLHHAAYGGAPVEFAERLIRGGAWRGLRTATGARPVDIALGRGHWHLLKVLEPPRRDDVPETVLAAIQERFHEVILGRAGSLVRDQELRLPELEVLLESEKVWFPVPGMYGGFSFRLEPAGADTRLVSDSWCRIVGGSEQRHVVTATLTEQIER